MFNLTFHPDQVAIVNNASQCIGELILRYNTCDVLFWQMVSGGHGWGCMPHGIGEITKAEALQDVPKNAPFKKEGFPWWAKITFLFRTRRTSIGLHGDGGGEGTRGCGGIIRNDIALFNSLEWILEQQENIKIYIL